MAWSTKGAGNMASMRAVRANGESVRSHYLAAKGTPSSIVEIDQEVKRGVEAGRGKNTG